MSQLVEGAVVSIDRRLVRIAIELAGSSQGAMRLLASLATDTQSPMAAAFLAEGGALIRARTLLSAVIDQATGDSCAQPEAGAT